MLRNAQLLVVGPLLHTLKHHVVAGCEDLINFRRKTNNKSCSYCTAYLKDPDCLSIKHEDAHPFKHLYSIVLCLNKIGLVNQV